MVVTPNFVHIVLQTNRLAEMKDWYCTLLGAHMVFENELLCFLTYDQEHHRIALVAPGGLTERTPQTVGMHHAAYSFPSLENLLHRYGELAALGIEPLIPVQHGVTTSLYYQDPDGNMVEFQVDNFPTPDEATDYMQGPEYAADPIGPSFDARRMADALAAGADPAELATRAWALAGPELPHPMTRSAGVASTSA